MDNLGRLSFIHQCRYILYQAYEAYLRITRSPLAARQRALKTEILTTKAELMRTSAQDQFAKWAKLRRSVDKGLAELEKLSEFLSPHINFSLTSFGLDGQIASTKSGFSLKFNTLLWLLTTGLQFAVGWWYRKQAVFYLPEGWFGPLGWWLSLPFAPAGMSPLSSDFYNHDLYSPIPVFCFRFR